MVASPVDVCVCVSVYLEYRECLEQAQISDQFVPCARLITSTYYWLYGSAKNLTRAAIAERSCR